MFANHFTWKKSKIKELKRNFKNFRQKFVKNEKEKELNSVFKEIKLLKKNNELINITLLEKKAKLGKINTSNVNKCLKKKHMTIKKLRTEIIERDIELAQLKRLIAL